MFQGNEAHKGVQNLGRAVNLAPGVIVRAFDAVPLETRTIDAANMAFLARHLPTDHMRYLLKGLLRPRAGDVMLARVGSVRGVDQVLSPRGAEIPLHAGMEVFLVYGRGWGAVYRLARIPDTLGSTHLIARCGIAGTVFDEPENSEFTQIIPLGLVSEDGENPLNIANYCHQVRSAG